MRAYIYMYKVLFDSYHDATAVQMACLWPFRDLQCTKFWCIQNVLNEQYYKTTNFHTGLLLATFVNSAKLPKLALIYWRLFCKYFDCWQAQMAAVRITSLSPKFNGSHFVVPHRSIHRKTGWVAISRIQWRMRTAPIQESSISTMSQLAIKPSFFCDGRIGWVVTTCDCHSGHALPSPVQIRLWSFLSSNIVKSCIQAAAWVQFYQLFGAPSIQERAFIWGRLVCNVLSLQNP